MPLYDYDCPGCGRNFEARMAMAQADEARCPHCGNRSPKRRLAQIRLKGQASTGAAAALPASGFG